MIQFNVVGIRFDNLLPKYHNQFNYTQKQIKHAIIKVKKQTQSVSVLLISTCDRVELWCESPKTEIVEPFLRSLSLSVLRWSKSTYRIKPEQALEHLYSLSCGLLSPLFGEDQIISQLQESLSLSRFIGCTSPNLEYIVRRAITLAKSIQGTIDLQVVDDTIADAVQAKLEESHYVSILVIGSSALARSVARHVVALKYQVWMTFRDLDKADGLLPQGVQAISYEQRFEYIKQVDVVISATKGMEYTIPKDKAIGAKLFFDLAPVRDIDPDVSMPLITMDDLQVVLPKREEAVKQCKMIIEQHLSETEAYLAYRPQVEDIQSQGVQAANELMYRLNSVLEKESQSEMFRKVLYESARKAFTHQLYEQQKRRMRSKLFDLTQCLESGTASYAGDPDTSLEPFSTLQSNGWRLTHLSFGSHTGTHMDSPAHLLENGKTLDTYPISRFLATAFVMDCSMLQSIDVCNLPSSDLDFDAILFSTASSQLPVTLSLEAAKALLARGVRLFGFDRPNCDKDGDDTLPLHHLLLGSDALIIENVTNLEVLHNRLVFLTCLPLHYKDADGSPARVMASLLS